MLQYTDPEGLINKAQGGHSDHPGEIEQISEVD